MGRRSIVVACCVAALCASGITALELEINVNAQVNTSDVGLIHPRFQGKRPCRQVNPCVDEIRRFSAVYGCFCPSFCNSEGVLFRFQGCPRLLPVAVRRNWRSSGRRRCTAPPTSCTSTPTKACTLVGMKLSARRRTARLCSVARSRVRTTADLARRCCLRGDDRLTACFSSCPCVFRHFYVCYVMNWCCSCIIGGFPGPCYKSCHSAFLHAGLRRSRPGATHDRLRKH